MAKSYRATGGIFPNKIFLLPPTLREWLPENHLAYFVSDMIDMIDQLDLDGELLRARGAWLSAYHPGMMTKVLVTATAWECFRRRSWRNGLPTTLVL